MLICAQWNVENISSHLRELKHLSYSDGPLIHLYWSIGLLYYRCMTFVFLLLTGGNWIRDGQSRQGNRVLFWNLYIFVHLLLPVMLANAPSSWPWCLRSTTCLSYLAFWNTFLKCWTMGRKQAWGKCFFGLDSIKLNHMGGREYGWLTLSDQSPPFKNKRKNKQLITLMRSNTKWSLYSGIGYPAD